MTNTPHAAAPAGRSASQKTDGAMLLVILLLAFGGLAFFMAGSFRDYFAMQAERHMTAEQCVANGGQAVENGNRVACKRADGSWRQLADS